MDGGERARAERLERELAQLCYAVSHDLRAPLRAIAGFAEILAEDYAGALPEDAQVLLQRIRARASRMDAMLQGLLELSRIQRGRLSPQEVDLAGLAVAAAERLRAAEPGRAVRVEIAAPLAARADPALASRLLEVLFDNAWKFTRATADAVISLRREGGAGGPWFVLRDNGAGFDRAAAELVFVPFQRFHAEKEFPGLGVGLALARAIVERHGGEIEIDSRPGAGTAVRFRLFPAEA